MFQSTGCIVPLICIQISTIQYNTMHQQRFLRHDKKISSFILGSCFYISPDNNGGGNIETFQVDPPCIFVISSPNELIFGTNPTCRCFWRMACFFFVICYCLLLFLLLLLLLLLSPFFTFKYRHVAYQIKCLGLTMTMGQVSGCCCCCCCCCCDVVAVVIMTIFRIQAYGISNQMSRSDYNNGIGQRMLLLLCCCCCRVVVFVI